LREVRRQFGVVLQESILFSGSVLSNIALSNPLIDHERVVEAATLAAIHDDITAMPMGYDTFVSEGGSALSGGQRQRIAIARAIAHKPAIILLDEATSHLDVETEHRVAENLRTLACTQIIIAHRLSTIRDADTILVLDQGTIVERGDHHDLLRRAGCYARLVRQQLERGEEATLLNGALIRDCLVQCLDDRARARSPDVSSSFDRLRPGSNPDVRRRSQTALPSP
jgi:ABC-type bacteriocin/lantibiotic exporter with double-glycine peptidase domain